MQTKPLLLWQAVKLAGEMKDLWMMDSITGVVTQVEPWLGSPVHKIIENHNAGHSFYDENPVQQWHSKYRLPVDYNGVSSAVAFEANRNYLNAMLAVYDWILENSHLEDGHDITDTGIVYAKSSEKWHPYKLKFVELGEIILTHALATKLCDYINDNEQLSATLCPRGE